VAAPQIVVEKLSFRYPGRSQPALHDVSFALEGGETLLVLGPSGGGKSTLALCLNGLIPHRIDGEVDGHVLVGADSLREMPVAEITRKVGLVFQDPDSQFCTLRVDDEIAFGLENLKVSPSGMPRRIAGALAVVGLAGHERARVDHLSGGAKQRLAIASILALEPSVLVFDEPTSNLDPAGAREVFAQIARLKADGNHTIVIVEHRLDQLMDLVDRVLVLDSTGSVAALGAPAQIFRDHASELDQLGVWAPQVSMVVNRLFERGIVVEPYPMAIDQADRVFDPLLIPGRALSVSATHVSGGPVIPSRSEESRPVLGQDSSLRLGMTANLRATDTSGIVAPAARSAIEISHLSWRYPRGPAALQDVSLVVLEGSFFAIVGPNGAGKSTLARHLIGMIRPARRTIHLFGRDLRDLRSAELTNTVGYVFQNPEHQFVAATVYDEVAFGLHRQNLDEATIRATVETLLEEFGLAVLAKANPFALSHGEKRRLSVASMLILEPRILVLDEPTFGQDRKNTEILLDKLNELKQRGRTIVIITHDLQLVAQHVEQVAVLVDGTLRFAGPTEDLFADPNLMGLGPGGVPPLLDLSRRLARRDPTFPSAATVDEVVAAITHRVRPSESPQALARLHHPEALNGASVVGVRPGSW
jgi:energy-coupling factor transport system ATP-binding protein